MLVTLDDAARLYQEKGSTIKGAHHCVVLTAEPKPTIAIRAKHGEVPPNDVVFLHDGTRPNTATNAGNSLQEIRFEVSQHLFNSPDLLPSDYNHLGLP